MQLNRGDTLIHDLMKIIIFLLFSLACFFFVPLKTDFPKYLIFITKEFKTLQKPYTYL